MRVRPILTKAGLWTKTIQEFLVMDDGLDEEEGAGLGGDGFIVTLTFIWDIRSLEKPKQTGTYKSKTKILYHNQYVINGMNYQSHYGADLRFLDVSSIPRNPTGSDVCEVGYFDIFPEETDIFNTIERGAFIIKITLRTVPNHPATLITDYEL